MIKIYYILVETRDAMANGGCAGGSIGRTKYTVRQYKITIICAMCVWVYRSFNDTNIESKKKRKYLQYTYIIYNNMIILYFEVDDFFHETSHLHRRITIDWPCVLYFLCVYKIYYFHIMRIISIRSATDAVVQQFCWK